MSNCYHADLPSHFGHVCAADSHNPVAQPLLGLLLTQPLLLTMRHPLLWTGSLSPPPCMSAGTVATVPGVA